MLYQVLFCQRVFAAPFGMGAAGFSGGTFDEERASGYQYIR